MAHLRDLKPDPHNARKHTPRNVGMIQDSLQKAGFGRSILIDEENTILAGNATVEAAGAAGLEQVRIVEADGTEVIAIRRTNLTPEQKEHLKLADNRAAELALWDEEQIARIAGTMPEVAADFFTPEELLVTIGSLADPQDLDSIMAGLPDPQHQDLTPARTLLVHFASQQDVEAFAQLLGQHITPGTKWMWYPAQPIAHTTHLAMVGTEEA